MTGYARDLPPLDPAAEGIDRQQITATAVAPVPPPPAICTVGAAV